MKKILLILGLVFAVSGCSLFNNTHVVSNEKEQAENEAYEKSVSVWQKDNKKVHIKKVESNVEVLPLIKGRVSKFKTPKRQEMTVAELEEQIKFDLYRDKYQRLVENVVVKSQNENSVTYEYKDARVDELAFLAVEYCREQNKKTAFLQKISLYKNRARLATFDCKSL